MPTGVVQNLDNFRGVYCAHTLDLQLPQSTVTDWLSESPHLNLAVIDYNYSNLGQSQHPSEEFGIGTAGR